MSAVPALLPDTVSAASTPSPTPVPSATSAVPPPRRGRRFRLSLRWIVPGVAAAVLAGALIFAGSTWERDSQSVLQREVQARLVLEARHLALTSASALLDEFPELTLQPMIRDLMRSRPDLESAIVVDRAGVVHGHPATDRLGRRWVPPATLAPMAASVRLEPGETIAADEVRLAARAPVRIAGGEAIGAAIVHMRRAHLVSMIEEARRRRTLITAVLLAIGTLTILASMALLLRPVGRLRSGIERIGRGDLDTPIALHDRTEFGMLAETIDRMAVGLREAQRLSIEKDRLAREMDLARSLQRSLLPSSRHSAGSCVLLGSQIAAAEVGGDYFDIVPLANGTVGFAIADVAGKGLGGCLIMTMLSALLRGLRDLYAAPSALLGAIDRSLSGSLPRGGFVTMTYGMLDPQSGDVTLSSAGHLPALVYRAADESVEWFRAKAPPVGSLRRGGIHTLLADERVTLGPGDLLVQITDGYQEAPAPDGTCFEFARIETVVRRHGREGAEAVIAALDAAVAEWTGGTIRDDQTILVVSRTPGAFMAGTQASHPADLAEPLALVARLQHEGGGLTLEGRLDELPGIRAWLSCRPGVQDADPRAERLLESALYEACANIIEHGQAGRCPTTIDLWRMPAAGPGANPREEVFVIRDRGAAFDPSVRRSTDFHDPRVRRRGRGLGLEMIQRIMTRVAYAGDTPEGNITVLRFDPTPVRSEGGAADDGPL